MITLRPDLNDLITTPIDAQDGVQAWLTRLCLCRPPLAHTMWAGNDIADRFPSDSSLPMRLLSNRSRPYHLGNFPLERLSRADEIFGNPTGVLAPDPRPAGTQSISQALADFLKFFAEHFNGPNASARAPVPDDPQIRTDNLKAAAYFLDCSMAAACELRNGAAAHSDEPAHSHALIVAVEFGKEPIPGGPGAAWIDGSQEARGDVRAAEIAAVIAGYIRSLGWSARGHVTGATKLDLAGLAVQAGLCRVENGFLVNPFIKGRFRLAAVSTDFVLTADRPLARDTFAGRWRSHGPSWWLGIGGTRARWEWLNNGNFSGKRPLHMGRYPMEKIRRVPHSTTLILPQEISRQPQRANFFTRAMYGDLGEKAKRERARFATKHPLAYAMGPLIRDMVALQDGPTEQPITALGNPNDNALAIKALGYYLGADMIGICEASPWMWYSHKSDGSPIRPYHEYAVVMLIDQGFETMEASSGDDWISGAQSMRAYLRGAEIASIMASHLRRLGYPARAHTNADSDILQIPAALMAGLGEMPRIGELVLNPFVGPRFKSVVLTTDLPMVVDKPIDFGLQDFCAKCSKCARECPCNAISFGPPKMFNGYEIWKPDVEKCVRYRLLNHKGSACGRCMKTCPFNLEGLALHRLLLWIAIHFPFTRKWLAQLDDIIGNGKRNQTKKWWWDLEMVNGVAVKPAGINERDLDLQAVNRAATQTTAYYPPEVAPPPGSADPHETNRPAAIRRAKEAETPAEARARLRRTP